MDIHEKFEATKNKVEELGVYAKQFFDSDDSDNEVKEEASVVTVVDTHIEKELSKFIREHFPEDSIVGEEGEGYQGSSSFVWHIDPIDGTDNFLREIPFTAISVARLGDTPEDSFGILHNPATGRTFNALMDGGVYEDSRTHNTNRELLGGRAIFSIGSGKEEWMKTAKYNLMKEIGLRFGRGTALNCVALELGYLAANRIDAVLSFGQKTYDYAAGLYMVRAAGGEIHLYENGEWALYKGSIKELCKEHGAVFLASHGGVAQQIIEVVGDPRSWAD